ncbi:fibroblast growth factor-binding protein 1 [Boleophthalmus pectinirostris]|uniref:fibroblast growth factor-binding protein 1 n=1 Tax=Boleophthalmus pectinirostris TaxID=150288 RepID=UPI000A1C1EE4|nr:fibroblast growth factor-binding protein 1 [Boleophthalmus pectinirostris]
MAFLTNATILLILACVSHQALANARRTARTPRQARSPQPIRGKTVTKDKAECTWAATGDDVFTLGVTCKKAGKRISCDYVARPNLCAQFAGNPKLYWRQIARSLKKQKDLCQDSNALVKAGMCRKAPRDAHFRLGKADSKAGPRSGPKPSPPAVRSCQPANKKLAQEYCKHAWSTFCTFFFTMVKDQDC